MVEERYCYLLINLLSISIPLLASFEGRISFYKKWKGLFLGILVMGVVFLSWDVAFTYMGVWGFNERYLTGVDIINLPLEEWLFFLAIPYSCLFIYEAMKYFIKRDILGRAAPVISLIITVGLVVVGTFHYDRWYTAVTFFATAGFLAYVTWILKARYLGRFYIGYTISLIPFLIVNGVLTGSWIEEQVVWYDNSENLGLRIGTIPVEDSMYMLLMLLIVTVVYEKVNSSPAA